MRRQDREVSDLTAICRILDHCNVMRLAFSDPDPYIIPVNFGYSLVKNVLHLYFHSAGEGRKIDLLRKSGLVAFEMDHIVSIRSNPVPCRWSSLYESVCGLGTAAEMHGSTEKEFGLDCIMNRLGSIDGLSYGEALDKVLVWDIEVKEIVGKSNIPDKDRF